MDLEAASVKAITESVAVIVAICTFLWGIWVYRSQKKRDRELEVAKDRLNRFEKFQDFQKRYGEEGTLIKVRNWIYREQHSSNDIPEPSDYELKKFMGFFEEIAIMINSGLMGDDLAAYTIGIDAARFYDTVTTYHEERYFLLFNSFALRMQERFKTLSEAEIKSLRF
ncbi:hypothetical protein ABIF63_005768 [Bradyrhizobium japonicum]|uniref:DUF4760 domain-containing protein n=1 Tax=Bradyrhizobium japonicum TaxID=375 RepID=A0ABV2RZF4_BRAJP|nr:hypothetical protein [Bradyrhizobium japonicum]UQD95241.1 hypothetical protein JEY30_26845 [Bradyrhizobium japonicum]WLB23446.1 hypothetical protein QIH95_22400 [Bradyrhizobium japonicum]